jgi:hypothetical protein
MSIFITDLCAKLIDDDTIWELEKPLLYQSSLLKTLVKIPEGFQTDFASIPRIPIIFEILGDTAHREGVLHDYLFRRDAYPSVSWNMANKALYEAMKCRKKPLIKRILVFSGVFIGSYPCFHRRYVADKIIK